MKSKRVKLLLRTVCIVLTCIIVGAVVFHVSGNERYFAGEAEAYYQALCNAGFPEDYAAALTELHLLHPTWEFVPLKVSQTQPLYTWSYVIAQETNEIDNNLISADESQIPYRHPLYKDVFDAGHYPASVEAVKYFMDPRNFLNEADIFQFYDLSSYENVSLEAVEAILASTFMENTYLENGMTYAEYFLAVGRELSVSPIYLAVKARQEQGSGGTSPIISGSCGTLLNQYYQNNTQYSEHGNAILSPSDGHSESELLALNGLYNVFNVGAKGNGLFSIYYNAMKRAQTGTDVMREAWGSPEWNTVWKSIYGGAYSIKASYIDRYQNTIYLQKFNVDSRSDRNFWGQYMQNVGGALTEGRTLYTSFASIGALDGKCTFLIPVYAGMSSEPSNDPAFGTCSYLAKATNKFTYSGELNAPVQTIDSMHALYLTQKIAVGGTLSLTGTFSHSYGISQLEYQWDGTGDWISCSDDGTLNLSLPVNFSENTSHILVIRGRAAYDHGDSAKKSNYNFLCAVVYVDVLPPPRATLTVKDRDAISTLTLTQGTHFQLPTNSSADFIGWHSSDNALLPAGAAAILYDDLTYQSLYLDMQQMNGAALIFSDGAVKLRFSAAIEQGLLATLQGHALPVRFFATVTSADTTQTLDVTLLETPVEAYDKEWIMMRADTDALSYADYGTAYTVSFYAEIRYDDGGERVLLCGVSEPFSRSATEVARAALADTGADYSPALRSRLRQIAFQLPMMTERTDSVYENAWLLQR
ncbi:MAG: hypothetical protein IJW29_06720 [Clostridia bacterium]|nr:hypothetical protein [Clostridia bacterium]